MDHETEAGGLEPESGGRRAVASALRPRPTLPAPYAIMAALFGSLAVLAALDSALSLFGVAPWFSSLRWLRVHLITLGVLVEVLFGLLPGLVAARAGRPIPGPRWGIWLALNAGLLTLLAGIPIVNDVLIVAGGTLVIAAAVLLLAQLVQLNRAAPERQAPERPGPAGRRFYLAGLGYLLLGVIAGTGLWLGWGPALGMAAPKEVHLHANLWGFSSLVIAGLIVDLYPDFAGRPRAWPRATGVIWWLLVLAGLMLVSGPWLGVNEVTIPGLLLHHVATALLLASMIRPLAGQDGAWMPGLAHLVAGYLWILAPLAAAPVAMLAGAQPPVASLEAGGPSLLVYGWVLQLVYALVPYVLARAWQPERAARLGGTWLSVAAVQLGTLAFVAGLFVEPYAALLQGIGFGLWAVGAVPIAIEIGRILSARMEGLEAGDRTAV